MFTKFSQNDIFVNRIKTKPNTNLKVYNGLTFYNNHPQQSGSFVPNVGCCPVGTIDLHQNNIDRPVGQRIYPYIVKDGKHYAFSDISINDYNSNFNYGDVLTGSYPQSASVSFQRYTSNQLRPKINSLQNTLNRNSIYSSHYSYNSTLGNKATQEIKFINIPFLFYGSSIEKGSVTCNFYMTGVLAAQLVDENQSGELKQKLPSDGNSGSVAGVVLYNEGCILLTGSWNIHNSIKESYREESPSTFYYARWIDFASTGSSIQTPTTASSFELDFRGINYVSSLTMFCHAKKGELNYSNNPTFLQYGQNQQPLTNSVEFKEQPLLQIKNVIKSPFSETTGSFIKTVYISKIGIYDKDKNLIGLASIASPIRKKETEDLTFKLTIADL